MRDLLCRIGLRSWPGSPKWVGFHTFRHTYSTLLNVKVVQELMLHANISTKMNIYAKTLASAKREAQSRVAYVLLDRSRRATERAGRVQHQNQRIESVSRFFCESAKLLILWWT